MPDHHQVYKNKLTTKKTQPNSVSMLVAKRIQTAARLHRLWIYLVKTAFKSNNRQNEILQHIRWSSSFFLLWACFYSHSDDLIWFLLTYHHPITSIRMSNLVSFQNVLCLHMVIATGDILFLYLHKIAFRYVLKHIQVQTWQTKCNTHLESSREISSSCV
jgi:hypothetical protein